MNRQFGLFLASFLGTFLFFGAVNVLQDNLEEFFLWQEKNRLGLSAALYSESFVELRPFRNWQVEHFESKAPSAIALFIGQAGQESILYGKNINEVKPIASLTKLMTSLVAKEKYQLDDVVMVPKVMKGDNSSVKAGQFFKVRDLLTFALLASNNSAAEALTTLMAPGEFVNLMNVKAANLGMGLTTFVNATGLDPDRIEEKMNLSTALDLIKLAKAILAQDLLVEIMGQLEATVYDKGNSNPHYLKNTNELLSKIPEVIFGKTGSTPLAKDCLILIAKAPKEQGKIILVILGSNNRFQDAQELLNWVKKAYVF